jgi:hypothetical protein
MSLVSLRGISLGFGGRAVFDGVDLHVEEGERPCPTRYETQLIFVQPGCCGV